MGVFADRLLTLPRKIKYSYENNFELLAILITKVKTVLSQ